MQPLNTQISHAHQNSTQPNLSSLSQNDRADTLNKVLQGLLSELQSENSRIPKEKVELMESLVGPSVMLPIEGSDRTLSKKIIDYNPKPLSGSGCRDYPTFPDGEHSEIITEANLAHIGTHIILSGLRSDSQESPSQKSPIDFSNVKPIGVLWPQNKNSK